MRNHLIISLSHRFNEKVLKKMNCGWPPNNKNMDEPLVQFYNRRNLISQVDAQYTYSSRILSLTNTQTVT